MDFGAIWAMISPYLNVGTIATCIGVVVGIAVKVRTMVRDIKANADMTEIFKKSLPSELVVSVQKLTKNELDALTAEVRSVFVRAIDQNTALVKELAKAICSLKSIPDSIKQEISGYLSDYQPETTEAIKLEMNADMVAVSTEKKEKKPVEYID